MVKRRHGIRARKLKFCASMYFPEDFDAFWLPDDNLGSKTRRSIQFQSHFKSFLAKKCFGRNRSLSFQMVSTSVKVWIRKSTESWSFEIWHALSALRNIKVSAFKIHESWSSDVDTEKFRIFEITETFLGTSKLFPVTKRINILCTTFSVKTPFYLSPWTRWE